MSEPKINPAFLRFVVKVEPPLPDSVIKNKRRVAFLAQGLTVHGTKRITKSKYGVAK